jgi:hypothetical protein
MAFDIEPFLSCYFCKATGDYVRARDRTIVRLYRVCEGSLVCHDIFRVQAPSDDNNIKAIMSLVLNCVFPFFFSVPPFP